jgi:hypothetical protein
MACRTRIAAKPELVQISTAYGQQQEGSKVITRSKYVEINPEKPDTPEKAKWPEFKTCKFTTEAIVSEGIDKGELRKVCTEADCPIHHPKKQPTKANASFKAEQDKNRRDEALANATGTCFWTCASTHTDSRIISADRTSSGIIVTFEDGKCVLSTRQLFCALCFLRLRNCLILTKTSNKRIVRWSKNPLGRA